MGTVVQLEQTAPQQEETSSREWMPVGVDLVKGKGRAPCDIFRQVPNLENRYVLLCRQDHPFTDEIRSSPEEFGLRRLYIRHRDTGRYIDYLNEKAKEIVADKSVRSEQKAVVVYNACQEVLEKVFDDPRATFINKAVETIAPTMNLIVADDTATRCLFKLTKFDDGTYTHSTNVGIFGLGLARAMYGEQALREIESLGAGFFLHDMGKTKVPLSIIQKPGPLTPMERKIMNRHPEMGYTLLEESGVMTDTIKVITLQHHEKDDGTGYPYGLKAADIHPLARICRLVDVYEAITAKRPYHEPRSSFEALRLMQETLLTDMDQDLFENFIRLFAS